MPFTKRTNLKSREDRTPPEFRVLLGLARVWAFADDSERCEFVWSNSLGPRRAIVADVLPHYEALESWIATERKRIPMPRGARKLELLLLAATEAIFDAYFGS